MVELTGFSKEEILEEDLFKEKYKHLLPMKTVLMEAVSKNETLVTDHWNPDRKQWFRISLFPVEHSLFVTLRDITEEKNQYQELLTVKNLKKHILNSTSDCIWAIDHEYNLILGNDAYYKIMRRSLGEEIRIGDNVLCKRWKKDLRGERIDTWKDFYDRALNGQRNVSTILLPEHQGRFLHEVTFEPVISGKNENRVIGVACFGRDISERAQHLESIEKQNSQLREIAWLQSHKMRAPLSNILGLTDLVLNTPEGDEKEELLQMLRQEAMQVDEIILEIAQKTRRV